MKPKTLLFLALVALAAALVGMLSSCSKSALNPGDYHQTAHKWVVLEGHDTASWDHAQFCAPQDYGKIDTVVLYYDASNPNKFSYVTGSIYFDIPGGRIPTANPGIFDRHYKKLLQELFN